MARAGDEGSGKARPKGSPGRRAGEGYCRRSPSTSLGSGPGSAAAAAASSCSSTNLFSSNSSMSTRRKREDSVFRAMAGARRPLRQLRSGEDLHSTPLGTGSGSGAGSCRPAPPPPPPRAAAAARPLPAHAGTGSTGGTEVGRIGKRREGGPWSSGGTPVFIEVKSSRLRSLRPMPRRPSTWTP